MIPFDSELWRKFCTHVGASEGGLSKDTNDPAVKCAPFAGAYHTNHGVTFCTWKANAPKVGFNPSYESFVKMTKTQADRLLYEYYISATKGGAIKNNAIALSLTEAYWGSGGYAFQNLATALKAMGYNVVSALVLTQAMINAANSADSKKLFEQFWIARLNFLKSLPTWSTYGNGWTARVNAFKKIFSSYAATLGIVFVAVLGYYAYRFYYSKS